MVVGWNEAICRFEKISPSRKSPYHHPSYVIADAKRDKILKPTFFVYEESGEIFYHAFHMAPIEDTGFFDIQSPYGYGGPISSTDDPVFLSRAWSAYQYWCRDHNIVVEFIRFHPLLENWNYYYGDVFEDRRTVWIDLSHHELFQSYASRCRNTIRKAIKNGLLIEFHKGAGLTETFSSLYTATMRELKAQSFYFFNKEYFQSLFQLDQTYIAVCKHREEVVAVAAFLIDGHIVEYHLSASNHMGKTLGATNLIIHETALFGQKLGCTSMHLGGGTDKLSNNPLLKFKEGFSELKAMYKIGRYVHQESIYVEMQKEWTKRHSSCPNRILFYRSDS
jgi:hypothetical protein